ncbi:MAG TPA: peptidase S41, partial [Chryseobacterium sp.]|nr:peptidase S41 [Chryseobacterium sp.]
MKSVLFFFLLWFVFSCNSVRQNNLFLQKKIPASELREDVDFTYKKLKRFHPNLYWYISKPQLDKKFDSLKQIITEPLTPNQFYLKLSPVIASIKEGHLRLRTFPRQYSKSEQKELKTKKPLFAMMDYKIIDNRMFVTDNKQNFGNIKPGTEILTINNENISDLTERYRRLFSSDGYNKTFQKYFINLTFFNYYTLENGFLDSAKLLTKLDNKVSEIIIRRQKKTEQELTKE